MCQHTHTRKEKRTIKNYFLLKMEGWKNYPWWFCGGAGRGRAIFTSCNEDTVKSKWGAARTHAEQHWVLVMRWMCLPLDTTRTHPCQGSHDQFELSSKCLQYGNWNRVCGFWTELVIVKPTPGNQEINQHFPVETLASANQRWISGISGSQQLTYIHTEDSDPEALPVAEATSTLCSPKHTQGFFFWSDFVLISCFPPKLYCIQLTVVIFMWQRQWIPWKKLCRNSKG